MINTHKTVTHDIHWQSNPRLTIVEKLLVQQWKYLFIMVDILLRKIFSHKTSFIPVKYTIRLSLKVSFVWLGK